MHGEYQETPLPRLIAVVHALQPSTSGQEGNAELIKELYMSATAYGQDLGHPSCILGTVQRITNAICSIRPARDDGAETPQRRHSRGGPAG